MSWTPPHDATSNDAAIAQAIADQETSTMLQSAARVRQSPESWSTPANTSRINCPLGCGLHPFEVPPAQRVNCNVCGKRLEGGERVYSCVSCNFDLCSVCKDLPAPSPPPPAATRTTRTPVSQPTQPSSHMCIVPCVIAGVCVEMMVDSGACTSVLSLELAKRLGLDKRMNRHCGVAMGVGKAKIVGKIRNVACMLGNVEFDIDFMVLDVPKQSLLLLGLDQMRKYKCVIDLEKERLVFGGSGGVDVPLLQPQQQHVQQQHAFRNPEECTIQKCT